MKQLHLILLSFLLLFFFPFRGKTQSENNYVTTVNISIYTSNYAETKLKIEDFTKTHDVKLINQNESQREYYVNIYCQEPEYRKLDSLFAYLGYISQKKLSTVNNSDKIKSIKLELDYLQGKKKAYSEISIEMAEKNNRYYNYWEEIRAIDKRIFELNLQLQNLKNSNNYEIQLHVYDETKDFTTDKISWVNMPGASFDFLSIESPLKGTSFSEYMGYSLKYFFTRGKSYANLSILKEQDNGTDTVAFSELFIFGFGQDFYTKYFGRGKRKFLNLYTGYNAGGLFATSDNRKKTTFYLTAFLGLEIFKNKYILIDNRVGYFVPFYENRNLRGIMYNASFNFVF